MNPLPPEIPAPAVILADPQLGENIGAVARAMANFGLGDLRLVRPRDGWPNARAYAVSSGATWILDGVRVFDTVAEALAGLTLVVATTARDREMAKEVLTPPEAARRLRLRAGTGAPTGLLFGSERAGLVNEDVVLADAVLTVPTDSRFSSMNIAQAALLVFYEWFRHADETPPASLDLGRFDLATKDELIGFFEQIEHELDEAGFLFPPSKRPAMVRNMRNIWQRAQLSQQDVRTMRGIVTALVHRPHARRNAERAAARAAALGPEDEGMTERPSGTGDGT
ncbi:MAG: RNA methyltransferase [Alphaproteobacteria bacterium]|nr:RNA methyltransferase [Alphaproteobacteria bacterium]